LSAFVVLQVVSPYSAEDAKGLIKAAVRDNDPGTLHEILLLLQYCWNNLKSCEKLKKCQQTNKIC